MFNKVCKRIDIAIKYLLCYLKWPNLYKKNIFVEPSSYLGTNTKIGVGTNINGKSYIDSDKNCSVIIGKHCAIAHNFRVRVKDHAICYPNMQLKLNTSLSLSPSTLTKYKYNNITVGNACWIGDNVIILPGGSVGNGVVLAAGSIVTKHIPSYSIAAGIPAKVIKSRVGNKNIEKLLENISWWDWDLEQMIQNKDFFLVDISNEQAENKLKRYLP
jgi:acetyltransferase-like isoleucine patch superfamily enzyme